MNTAVALGGRRDATSAAFWRVDPVEQIGGYDVVAEDGTLDDHFAEERDAQRRADALNECAEFHLPQALRPLRDRHLAFGIAVVLGLLALTGCGGGDPEDFGATGGRKSINPPACSASGVCS